MARPTMGQPVKEAAERSQQFCIQCKCWCRTVNLGTVRRCPFCLSALTEVSIH